MSRIRLLAILVISLLTFDAKSQTQKIGVVDADSINKAFISSSVEYLNAEQSQKQLNAEIEEAKIQIKAKKASAAQLNDPVYSKTILAIDNDSRILFNNINDKQELLEKQKRELMQTFQNQVKSTIKQIAEENNYTTILELKDYPNSISENNITQLVLDKLGIN